MILEDALKALAETGERAADVAQVIRRLAQAAVGVRQIINEGALGAAFSGSRDTRNAGGDVQYDLDVHADEMFLSAMHKAPIALYATEELERPVRLQRNAKLGLAIDPLDGSSNIATNVSIGTIFSIMPVVETQDEDDLEATFLQLGSEQLAAGFFVYGPQLALVVTWGEGTRMFLYSARQETFVQVEGNQQIPRKANEFAVNASNYRHWPEAVRLYVDDALQGSDGPREKDYNMRWIASLVADCYRILVRGGIFLYPGDNRQGYARGRLRTVYEANPIAMLIEQAGGMATNGAERILDLKAETLHERSPLVFGSTDEVARIVRYYNDPSAIPERSPLFGTRGLFRD